MSDGGAFIPRQNGAAGFTSAATDGISSIAGGTSTATGPLVSFANSNNVSFGISGNTVTASVVPDAGIGLAVPGTTISTGTVVLSNSNGISFGINGSTVTATAAALKTISAGTTNATGQGVSFADGSGVTFGINGNTLTASVAAGATATGNFGAISAAGGVISSGTASFADSNGIAFGVNGQTVTASQSPWQVGVDGFFGGLGVPMASDSSMFFSNNGNVWGATSAAPVLRINLVSGPITISAGTQAMAGGSMVFANSNGVTFGMSGSSQITASVAAGGARVSFWDNSRGNLMSASMSSASVFDGNNVWASVQRISFGQSMALTRLEYIANFAGNGSVGGNAATIQGQAVSFGIYTMSGSTASIVSTFSQSYSYNNTTTASSTSNDGGQSGLKWRTMSLSTAVITPGEYLLAIGMSATAASAGATSFRGISAFGGLHTTNLPYAGLTTNVTRDYFYDGVVLLTAASTTATLPNSIHLSAINSAFTNPASINAQFPLQPYLRLLGT